MGDFSASLIVENAYRVLGLAVGASQAEIDAAARRMRIWPNPAQIPKTPMDIPWLGTLNRSKSQIEQAVARLNDPVTRIEDRLFWFIGRPAPAEPTLRSIAKTLPPVEPMNVHDLALAQIAWLLLNDPQASNEDLWWSALSALLSAAQSDAYRQWFLAVEANGDFEKRATDAEVCNALSTLPLTIATALAKRAREALDHKLYLTCLRFLWLGRLVSPDAQTDDTCEKSVCDRVEDLLVSHCNQLNDELCREINWDWVVWYYFAASNKKVCKRVAAEIRRSVDPMLEALTVLAGADSDRIIRIRPPLATMYRSLALGWRRALVTKLGDRNLQLALKFAKGTPLEARIERDIADIKARTFKAGGFDFNWLILLLPVVLVAAGIIERIFNPPPDSPNIPTTTKIVGN